MWTYDGTRRPDFAEPTGPGQESVWDYPRPPRVEPEPRVVRVTTGVDDGAELAVSARALRVLETASPPTVYLPRDDLRCALETLDPKRHSSFCEWKGTAHYLALEPWARSSSEPVAWFYPEPSPAFARLRNHVALYPSRVACFLGDERVRSQPGGFYGGWITDEIVGPWKGDPGSGGW